MVEISKQENCTQWGETWGLSLAYAITQTAELAERLLAEAVVAFVASQSEVSTVKFATAIWDLSQHEAFRGFGEDPFFRMPPVARAIVVLKVRAQFSRPQIAAALRIRAAQVDQFLENARLLFSDGRPWIQHGPALRYEGDRLVPECPQWWTVSAALAQADASENAPIDIQEVFSKYLGGDLDIETNQKLYSHLVVCTGCRNSFAHFKQHYIGWTKAVPALQPQPEYRQHLRKVTKMAVQSQVRGWSRASYTMKNRPAPPILPGFKKVLRDAQVRTVLLSAASLMLLHFLMKRH